MKKREIIENISDEFDVNPKKVNLIISRYIIFIKEIIRAGGTYNEYGFGTFSTQTRDYNIRNIHDGKMIEVKDYTSARFKSSIALKGFLNGK